MQMPFLKTGWLPGDGESGGDLTLYGREVKLGTFELGVEEEKKEPHDKEGGRGGVVPARDFAAEYATSHRPPQKA